MTNAYQGSVSRLVVMMYYIAGVAIVAMMLLTVADVTLRIFRMPINGTYEVVSYLGALAISFAIAHTSVEKGHVAVTFVVDRLPVRIGALVRSVTGMMSFGFFAAISWQSVIYGNELRLSGELSPTIQIPFYPIVYGIAFAAGIVCLVILEGFVENARKVFGK